MSRKKVFLLSFALVGSALACWSYRLYQLDEARFWVAMINYGTVQGPLYEVRDEFHRIIERREKYFGPNDSSLIEPLMQLSWFESDFQKRKNESVADKLSRLKRALAYSERAMAIDIDHRHESRIKHSCKSIRAQIAYTQDHPEG